MANETELKDESTRGKEVAEISDAKQRASMSPFSSLGTKFFLRDDPVKVVAIVSCNRGEGVTHVSQALRNFLTLRMSSPVSLLSAEECLDTPASERSRPIVSSTLPVGHGPAPSECLLAAIREKKVVLIDCPSLASSAEILWLAPHVDGVLLVVEDGQRSKAEIQRAVGTIEAAQGRVLGIILNKRRYLLPRWLYSILN